MATEVSEKKERKAFTMTNAMSHIAEKLHNLEVGHLKAIVNAAAVSVRLRRQVFSVYEIGKLWYFLMVIAG